MDHASSKVHVLKLHGCLHLPTTITATVEQEGQGLSEEKLQVIDELLKRYYFVFWGYSGADLKISLDYLHMETMHEKAKGFVWNFLLKDGWKEPVNSYVQKLVQLYKKKASLVHGKLPDIFDQLLASGERIERFFYKAEDERQLLLKKNESLQESLNDWGKQHLSASQALSIFGKLLKHSGQMDEAHDCYNKIAEVITLPKDHKILSNAYNEIGYIYKTRSDYDASIKYFQKAEEIAKHHDDQRSLALYLNSIGGIYRVWRKYDKALLYYTQAEKIARKLGDQQGLAMYLSKLGGIYKASGSWDKSLKYFEEAKAITKMRGDKQGLAINLDNIGKIYRDQKETAKALEYFKEAEEITRILGDKQGLAVRFSSLASIYKKIVQRIIKLSIITKKRRKLLENLEIEGEYFFILAMLQASINWKKITKNLCTISRMRLL